MSTALSNWRLSCRDCGASLEAEPCFSGCPACVRLGRLSMLELTRVRAPSDARPGAGRGLDRYAHLLPIADPDHWCSLGAGGTALVHLPALGQTLSLSNLHVKVEVGNPTHSFKDRYVALTLNAARANGARETVVSSTGNLGVSAAAYAAAYRIDCTTVVPHDIPASIAAELTAFGSALEEVPIAARFARFETISERPGCYPVGLFMNRKVQNPFGVEGYRTLAYELIESLGRVPDYVLFPCARGNGLYGCWKGFQDALEWGWTSAAPRMVGCQPALANSLEVSIASDAERAIETAPAQSVARSISETVTGDHAIGAVRQSHGAALSATEDEISAALRLLGRHGISTEAASATTVACLAKLTHQRALRGDETIVCILTGPGFRWPQAALQ
jgi:threonine synthase